MVMLELGAAGIRRVRERADIVGCEVVTDDEIQAYFAEAQREIAHSMSLDAMVAATIRKCRQKQELPDAP